MKWNHFQPGERTQHPLGPYTGKKRWVSSGKYTGNLRYNLTREQEKKILLMRHGPELDMRGPPRMAQHKIG